MISSELETALRSMIHRYGFMQVDSCLKEIGRSEAQPKYSKSSGDVYGTGTPTKPTSRGLKISAKGYVAKLDLPPEKTPVMVELAKRFESKAFLPTFGDIAHFCQVHGLETPVSKSRANSIPRLFKFIATMDSQWIQTMLDEGRYSGPSQLGPIADAIRKNGRASITPGFR